MLRHRFPVRSRQPGYSRRVRSVTPSLPSGALRAQGPASHLAGSKQRTQASSWAVGFSCFLPSRSLGRAPVGWALAARPKSDPGFLRLPGLTSPAPPPPLQPSQVLLSLGSRGPSLLWVPFPQGGSSPTQRTVLCWALLLPTLGSGRGSCCAQRTPTTPIGDPWGSGRRQARVVGSAKVKRHGREFVGWARVSDPGGAGKTAGLRPPQAPDSTQDPAPSPAARGDSPPWALD